MFGTYTVALEDGTEHTVKADNRDFIAFRRRGFRDLGHPSPDVMTHAITEAKGDTAAQGLEMIEFLAWLVWNAGQRTGEWATDFETFTEKECVSFALLDGGDVDPTNGESVAPSTS